MGFIREDLSNKRRLYVQTAYGEAVVEKLKEVGMHWDKDAKCWWISPKKRDAVLEVLVGADQKEDQERELGMPTPKEDPRSITILAKVRYKDRTYYARAFSDKYGTYKAKLISLDGEVEFWAKCLRAHESAETKSDHAQILKFYEDREVWDGVRYSGRRIMVKMTLGKIQDFVAKQKNPETRTGACTECGQWGPVGMVCTGCCEGSHA